MTVIELRFPAGRFHATPWGRHVNEGSVEWPVEPWRLLRALISTWFHKARADVEPAALARLVTALAETLPAYHLPAASLGHTRHYMPFNEGKNEKTTKIFDAFVHVAQDQAVRVAWETDLADTDRATLARLLPLLGYLGRAESLVEARLLDAADGDQAYYNTRPLADGATASDRQELVVVLAPLPEAAYQHWRQGFLASARPAKPPKKGKGNDALDPVPADLFGALLADTGELKAAGWNLPPGAQRVTYVRPADAFRLGGRAARPRADLPTVARFALASAVLPSITAAVSVGDRVHQALVSRSGGLPVFTGHAEGGTPRRGHDHAYILPETGPANDRIHFLTVYAREGFDAQARRVLSNMPPVWGHGGHDIQLILLGLGQPEQFGGLDAQAGQSSLLGESDEWVSLTPFVPTRHGKRAAGGAPKLDADGFQVGGPAHDLRRLLRLERQGVEVLSIEEEKFSPARGLRWLQFQRVRPGGEGTRAGLAGYGFRMRFGRAVRGPVAVGYGAHFGLGLFVPAPSVRRDERSSLRG